MVPLLDLSIVGAGSEPIAYCAIPYRLQIAMAMKLRYDAYNRKYRRQGGLHERRNGG
jgi:hypothetical protein